MNKVRSFSVFCGLTLMAFRMAAPNPALAALCWPRPNRSRQLRNGAGRQAETRMRLQPGISVMEDRGLRMKRFARTAAATTALLALAGGTSPAAASDSCDRLSGMAIGNAMNHAGGGGRPVNSLAPENVNVELNMDVEGGSNVPVVVSWTIPSGLPTDVLTGFCVNQTLQGALVREICIAERGRTISYLANCVQQRQCSPGSHSFKVRLTTSCGFDLPWSEAVSADLGG